MGRLLLVRHGQASWGADDYDVLSPLGHQQAGALGEIWRHRGLAPDQIVIGGMRRHRETCEAAGLVADEVDPGWDEFDHLMMLARVPAPDGADSDPRIFQQWFETASDRWLSGNDDYDESFAAFTERVTAALGRIASRSGTTAVFTSGGAIAWAVASLLSDEPAVQQGLWTRLNRVCANTGVTHLVSGRRGLSMVSFNEHTHLEGASELISYR